MIMVIEQLLDFIISVMDINNKLIILYGTAMTNTTNTTNIAITKGVIATTTKEASAHTLYASNFVQNSKFSLASTSGGAIRFHYIIIGS